MINLMFPKLIEYGCRPSVSRATQRGTAGTTKTLIAAADLKTTVLVKPQRKLVWKGRLV
jgi:hypothetical protein